MLRHVEHVLQGPQSRCHLQQLVSHLLLRTGPCHRLGIRSHGQQHDLSWLCQLPVPFVHPRGFDSDAKCLDPRLLLENRTTRPLSVMGGRERQWQPPEGVLGIRWIFISLTSRLTIFSFLRAERFSDARVLSFCDHPRTTPFHDERLAPTYINLAEFGWFLDMKTLFISSITVAISGLVVTVVIRLMTHQPTYIFCCRSCYVPWSVGTICPASMLSVFWFLPLVSFRDEGSLLSWRRLGLFVGFGSKTTLSTSCVLCNAHTSALHWRRIQGCTRHDAIFHINRRSKNFWSAIRLVNIDLLSDPWQLYCLYGAGRHLYVYRPRMLESLLADEAETRVMLLPRQLAIVELDRTATAFELDGDLVGVVNSTCVPWSVLVSCG